MRRMVLLAVLAFVPGVVKADLVFYSTRGQFDAGTTAQTNINFEGLAANNGFIFYSTPPGVTLSGANFNINHTNNNGNLYAIGQNFYYPGTSVLSSQQTTIGLNNIVVTLPGLFTAFAVDVGSFGASNVTFTLSTGDVFNINTPNYPAFSFVGFASTLAFNSVRIETTDNVLNIDNVSFATAVPVPSGMILAGVGVITLAGYSWRKRLASRSV